MSKRPPHNNENDSDSTEKSNQWLIYFIAALVATMLLAAGVNPTLVGMSPAWCAFFKELAIAIYISLIIIFTIERFQRKQHSKAADNLIAKINDNLFYAIYKRYIPDEIFTEVERCLMETGVIRENYKVTYKFETAPNDMNGHYLCSMNSEYRMKNIRDSHVDEMVRARLELPVNKGLHPHVKVTAVTIGRKEYTEQEIADFTTNDGINVTFEKEVTVPPEGLHVSVAGNLIKQVEDVEVWTTSYPADGMELEIYTPPDCQVEAHVNHSKSKQLKGKRELLPGDGKKFSLKIEYGILPFQSIVFWWSNANNKTG